MDNVTDQENDEKSIDTYNQCFSAEVCLPDERWRKIMTRVTNRVKVNDGKSRGIEHPTFFAYHSLFEVSFTNGWMEELPVNVISENMLYKVDSEGNNYQVLKDIRDHSAYGIALKRNSGSIRSCGGNLPAKKTTIGWKLEE